MTVLYVCLSNLHPFLCPHFVVIEEEEADVFPPSSHDETPSFPNDFFLPSHLIASLCFESFAGWNHIWLSGETLPQPLRSGLPAHGTQQAKQTGKNSIRI